MKSKVYIIHSQIALGWQGLLTSFKMTLKFRKHLEKLGHNQQNMFIFKKNPNVRQEGKNIEKKK